MFRRLRGLWKPSQIHLSKSPAHCANRPVSSRYFAKSTSRARLSNPNKLAAKRSKRNKSVMLNELQNIAVHNKSKDAQEEDEANLHETFFYRDAEIPADRAFDCEHQHVAAVENWNGKKVQQTEIQANNCHEFNQTHRTALGGASRLSRDTNDALKLANRDLSSKESGKDVEDLAH